MSRALIAGLVQANSGDQPSSIHVFDRNPEKNAALHAEFGVSIHLSAENMVEACDVLVIAVKPQGFKAALETLKTSILSRPRLIISVAAGIPTAAIRNWLSADVSIVRAMPNMPALINEGATGMYASEQVNASQKQTAEQILGTVGVCEWVNSDHDIDVVTALSGSGPAYIMLLAAGMISAAENAGLARQTATRLAIQTLKGTALMVAQSTEDVTTLIEHIRSPNGTTDRALKTFDQLAFSQVVEKAMEAARVRANELGDEFGQ